MAMKLVSSARTRSDLWLYYWAWWRLKTGRRRLWLWLTDEGWEVL